jgi:hypothetical protein
MTKNVFIINYYRSNVLESDAAVLTWLKTDATVSEAAGNT